MSIRQLSALQRITLRHRCAEKLANENQLTLRQAIREIDAVTTRATAEQLAAACGCAESVFANGLFTEPCIAGVLTTTGFAVPVAALGDGTFLKWLFSDEGREAILKWIEMIVKIVSILGPLFI